MKKPLLIVLVGAAVLAALAWTVEVRLRSVSPSASVGISGSDLILGDRSGTPEGADGGGTLPVIWESMPEFSGITAWLNSDPLRASELRGRVVLIDFWTYSCINCIRTLPFVTSLYRTYKDGGLLVVGVHTPEFDFERKESNVRRAIGEHGIEYPVALDNEYGTWTAYRNRYWPAKYLFDHEGKLRFVHFGEGEEEVTERNIRTLLAEAGGEARPEGTAVIPPAVDFGRIGTPETYLGAARQEGFASPERIAEGRRQTYSEPDDLALNRFAFSGAWIIRGERAELAEGEGTLVLRYDASVANLVMGSDREVVAEVTLDGRPIPEGFRGKDILFENGRTFVRVEAERLYELVNGAGQYGEHVIRITFPDGGVRVYAFTFG